jgi:capsular exopolysaccharide synthesis family protein
MKVEVRTMESLNIVSVKHPKSPISEAYRTLRTNIQFSSLDEKIKTIVITSSGPGEGKTTTASNLAVSFAGGGHKTILIDCDQRKPSVHKLFNLSNQTGLSNLLIGETSYDEAIHKTEVDDLFVLTSGTRPPNPSELLASTKMQRLITSLKEKFDYIILDTPPIIMVTDAQILSKYADGCLLVVGFGEADKNAGVKAKELLEKVNAKVLGVVLNKIDTSKNGYYEYYYHYYYSSEHKKQSKKLGFSKLFKKKK